MLDALALLPKRIKSTDRFDVTRFLIDAQRILADGATATTDWTALRQRANERRESLRAATDPWALLDIDWDVYHPSARRLLDDPWFWSGTDNSAPHGNDTGSDLLHEFLRWDASNRSMSPLTFLADFLRSWQIEPIAWHEIDPATVHSLLRDDPFTVEICNRAAIGLAFALVKVRGTCPNDIADMANTAIERQTIALDGSTIPAATHAAERRKLERMRNALNRLS